MKKGKPVKSPAPPRHDAARMRKLELLLEFGKRISSEHSLDPLLDLLAKEAKAILDADRCTIFVLDRAKKILWSKVAQGESKTITIPEDKGIAGECVQTRRLLNIRDAYKDSRFNPLVDKQTGYHTKSILTMPMINMRDQAVGAFQVLNKTTGTPFETEDEEILSILASQAAVGIENAQLYDQVRKAAEDTIFRLAAAAEYKDKDTASHLIRMSRYSALIAQAMGYPDDYCQKLLLASPMHDIGKLGVPDAILMKPGKLDESEWVEMKQHPVYGAKILNDSESELLQMSAVVALSHHEKFDGTGYPSGLKGSDIPIEGRIVALADVFDALTSRRVYKPKFSLDDTLKIIRDCSGKHFDPEVVAAFEKALPEISAIMVKYADKPEEQQTEIPKDQHRPA